MVALVIAVFHFKLLTGRRSPSPHRLFSRESGRPKACGKGGQEPEHHLARKFGRGSQSACSELEGEKVKCHCCIV